MKNTIFLPLLGFVVFMIIWLDLFETQDSNKDNRFQMEEVNLEGIINFAVAQYKKVRETLGTDEYPHIGHPNSTHWITTKGTNAWTAGFYPGIFWLLYQHSQDPVLREYAEQVQEGVKDQQYRTDTHDVGFVIMSSYGNGFQLTRNSTYLEIIRNAATSLATRFSPKVRCTRSWGPFHKSSPVGEFTVIIDGMMNLELLLWAAAKFDVPYWREIAISHAERTMKEHFREDKSTWHVVGYNEATGLVIRRATAQGFSDESCWSRGQAWAIYGYTMMWRYTKRTDFLHMAKQAADFFITNLPDDKVPFWDFNAPPEEGAEEPSRDTSAAAIAASALLELGASFDGSKKNIYFTKAVKILMSLSSPKYLANGREDYHIPAILVHGTSNKKGNFGVDVALIYGDYYYLQALLRLKNYPRVGSVDEAL